MNLSTKLLASPNDIKFDAIQNDNIFVVTCELYSNDDLVVW